MKIKFEKQPSKGASVDLRVIAIRRDEFEQTRSSSSGKLKALIKKEIGEHALETLIQQGFNAKHEQTALFSTARGKKTPSILVVGVDHSSDGSTREHLERFRSLGATIALQAAKLSCRRLEVSLERLWVGDELPLEAFWEGLVLSRYEYRRYKTSPKKEKDVLESVSLVTSRPPTAAFVRRMQTICDNVAFARDLINTPPNDLRPTHLANICKQVAREGKLQLELLDTKKLTKIGAGGILCVGMGSGDQAYLAHISYKPKTTKKVKRIALVGKAVTFDTGGLVIKTSMDTMKCDMSGGATVLATMRAIAMTALPIEVHAYIPIVENMINGDAFRPGDVFTLLCGKTVEVLNTDAEGRLILADALTMATKEKPDMIIDLATLTGACAAALGSKFGGMFTNSPALAELLTNASDLSGEPLWELPLASEYRKLITSDVADYKNLFKDARAITAALFLEEFVEKIPWAHLDIAGPAFASSSEGVIRAGGVGFGVRTLIRLLEDIADDVA